LFTTYILIALTLVAVINIPFVLWQILDFLKSGLTKKEYKFLSNSSKVFVIFTIMINYFSLTFIFPILWKFFTSLEMYQGTGTLINLSLELKVEEYLKFFNQFVFITNVFVMTVVTLFVGATRFGISNLVYWKKLFILVNIMFATLLSPPDVYSQIMILSILSIILEIILFCFILKMKLNKLIWHNVERN
jgi:Sec-independent protein secretion pathway component TatC